MNTPAILNTIGIVNVALGSVFVAYEVVQRFKGERYEVTTGVVLDSPMHRPLRPVGAKVAGVTTIQAQESDEYLQWEKRRNIVMSVGLGLILIGSTFQIWATWA